MSVTQTVLGAAEENFLSKIFLRFLSKSGSIREDDVMKMNIGRTTPPHYLAIPKPFVRFNMAIIRKMTDFLNLT